MNKPLANRRGTSRTPLGRTRRSPENVLSRETVTVDLWPASRANVDFLYYKELRAERGDDATVLQGMRLALVASLEDHLGFMRQNMERLMRDLPGAALPVDQARALLRALKRVAGGEADPLLTPRTLSNGRGNLRSAAKQDCVDWAVWYLTAADLDWASDSESRKRVAECFGVTRRQVRRWIVEKGSLAARKKSLERWMTDNGFDGRHAAGAKGLRKLLPFKGEEYSDQGKVSRRKRR